MPEKPTIVIPESGGQIGMTSEVKSRFDKIDKILIAVVASVLVSLVAVIISAIGLFLDQMRYNNAAYKEYTEKLEVQETLQESNDMLLEQNKQYQELIIKQQEQIIGTLKER